MNKLKQIFLNLLLVVSVLGIISSIIFFICVRFQNPDLTDMRLTLMYWKELLATFVLVAIAGISAKLWYQNV